MSPPRASARSPGGRIIALIRARMGDVQVVLEPADAIPRTSNGKFRSVICDLPAVRRDRPDAPHARIR